MDHLRASSASAFCCLLIVRVSPEVPVRLSLLSLLYQPSLPAPFPLFSPSSHPPYLPLPLSVMRSNWRAITLLIPALAVAFVSAAPRSTNDAALALAEHSSNQVLVSRDDHAHGHGHNHHAQPLVELNETEVLMHHAPTPPSYWTIDFVEHDPSQGRYPGLMGLHILFMGLAFFGALPIG